MFGFNSLGKILIIFALVFAAIGVFPLFMPKIPWLGRLPGEVMLRRGNLTIYFPWVTCLLISILLTLLLAIFRK